MRRDWFWRDNKYKFKYGSGIVLRWSGRIQPPRINSYRIHVYLVGCRSVRLT